MKIIVASSERFAGCMVPALIRAGHQVAGVISPVKGIYDRQFKGARFIFYDLVGWDMRRACTRYKVPLRVSARLNDGAILAFFKQIQPDLLVVFSWPQLIDQTVLSHFTKGGMNIHPSLLPKLRGADPLFSLVDDYRLHFGVTFHRLAEEMDAGPLFLQKALDFSPRQTYDDLYLKTIRAINRHLPRAINQLASMPKGTPQQGTPTTAAKFQHKSRILDLEQPVSKVTRRALACYSHHPMMTSINQQVFTVKNCQQVFLRHSPNAAPGTILAVGLTSLTVKLGQGYARLEGIRFTGKPWWQTPFLLTKLCRPGDKLGDLQQTSRAWTVWKKSSSAT